MFINSEWNKPGGNMGVGQFPWFLTNVISDFYSE